MALDLLHLRLLVAISWACRVRARRLKQHSLTLYDHPEGIRMPRAKFHADLLENVAVHKQQRKRRTDSVFYIFKI